MRLFIATPDAEPLDRLDETFASVASQSGDLGLTYLVNDPNGALEIEARLPTWRAEAERLRGPRPPLEIVLSRHAGLGDFDTLDRMLADAPNTTNVVLMPLPCGCRLAPGALEIVAGVMADQPAIDLVRGLAAAFGPHGVMTGLSFGPAAGTWDMIGAVVDGTRDQRDLPGGLFWRSILWHRLGRMNPALIYAGYLDFCSKAAVHAQVGQIEAVLVEDRYGTFQPEEAGCQEAEIVSVQLRAARRQARLHGQMLDGMAEPADIRPPLSVAYDADSRRWRLREPPYFLDPLCRAEIGAGFTEVEGPYPEAALPHRFRWTRARSASFSVVADRGRHKIFMRLRNPSAGQTLSLDLNGTSVFRAQPQSASLLDAIEVDVICDFRQGRNELTLIADVMLVDAAGQSLGLIVEGVEITGSPS